MVEDDLPTGGAALQNQAEHSANRTARGGIAIEMPIGGNHGNLGVQRLDDQIRKAERSHGGADAIGGTVMLQDLGARDGAGSLADQGGRIGIVGDKARKVAFVPIRDLRIENGMDFSLSVAGEER